MRIAFITEPWNVVWPKDNGGAFALSMLTYQLARRLTDMGHEVAIFSKQGRGQPADELDHLGIQHYRINLAAEEKLMKPLNLLDRFQVLGRLKHPLFAAPFYYAGFLKQIGPSLARWQPDIVHIHDFSQYAPMVRRIVPNARIVLHMHCEWLSQLGAGMIRRRLRHVDLVIGCSQYITNKVRQRFPEFSERCQTVYNGADLSQFSPREGQGEKKCNGKVLLYAGRISPEKGIHVILDAFSIVLKKFPDACLRIAGPVGSAPPQFTVALFNERLQSLGQFYPSPFSKPDYYYRKLSTRLPSEEMQKVSFLGPIPYINMRDIYHKADIYINSSLLEAYGLPIVEAIASGLPVVASEVGGVPELVRHEETGLLFPPGDSERLAQAIIRLLQDEDLSHRLRLTATKKISGKFSWDTVTDELLRHYQSLLLTSSLLLGFALEAL